MEMTKRFASNLDVWSTSDKKALLVNQLWKNESRKSLHRLMEIEQDILKASGVQVDYMKGEADTTFYMSTDFSKYDYIHLVTHGCYNPKDNTHRIFSSSEFAALPPEPKHYTNDQIFEMFNPGSKFSYGVVSEIRKVYGAEEGRKFMVYYSCLTENDIKQKKSQSERTTILFNAACQSLKGNDQMAKAFFERGVDVYLGYDETNSVGHIAGKTLFCELMNGLSFDYVLQDRILPEWKTNEFLEEGKKVIANLKDKYNSSGNNVNKTFNDYFAFPVITNDNEESEASSLNDTQWKINVSGTTKAYKFEKELKCGFIYGTNREELYYWQECDEKDIKFKNHELTFNTILIPDVYLYGCDSLYYQAYTYDGLHYNLGDIKSIPGNLRQLRQQLIKFYESTGGENWIRNDNWCSDKPLREWYRVLLYVTDNVTVDLYLWENNLTGEGELVDCKVIHELLCSGNQLSSLDVSGCTALQYLSCGESQLTRLDVSGCTALQRLNCFNNQLTSLDISGYTALYDLHCDNNQLTSLDVSGCTVLLELRCENNKLTSLNVSGCTALEFLYCENNQLTGLDVSGCAALRSLHCENNHINQEISEFFRNLGYGFYHDCKYDYKYDSINDKWIITTNEYGWWYPGEPESHCHGW